MPENENQETELALFPFREDDFPIEDTLWEWDGGRCPKRGLTEDQLIDEEIAEAYREQDLEAERLRGEKLKQAEMLRNEHFEKVEEDLRAHVRGGKINRRK
jgi:hypothetical protein